jgi:hypothetical protein
MHKPCTLGLGNRGSRTCPTRPGRSHRAQYLRRHNPHIIFHMITIVCIAPRLPATILNIHATRNIQTTKEEEEECSR